MNQVVPLPESNEISRQRTSKTLLLTKLEL